jgi:hypothetical protein
MYFEINQVNDTLLCQQCKGRLEIPKILPCGETICLSCETYIQINENMFDCLVCKQKHDVPNGFLISKAILKMLKIEPTKVSRGEVFDKLEKSLENIQNKCNYIHRFIDNRNDLVKKKCMNLRSDVQLKTEQVIFQINEISTKIIVEIDKYEQEMSNFNSFNTQSLKVFNQLAKDLESFYDLNTKYLKRNIIDDKIMNKSNEEATSLIAKAELEIDNLIDVILNGTSFKFDKSNEKINKSILGSTKIEKFKIDSVILLYGCQIKKLMTLCEFPIDQKWNLIYKASQDGFEASSFHSKCDSKPNTLVLIKSEIGNIFGGYTEQSWSDNNVYKSDSNAFIFSLINRLNKPVKINCSNIYEAIYCHNKEGPTFGLGPHDIRIRSIKYKCK